MDARDAIVQRMKELARAASERAYAPYSRFPVGAAVLTDDGQIFAACNVENASYSLGLCAERNAVCQAVAAGHLVVTAVVVYTPTRHPTLPCGACRQVIHEFGPGAEIFSFATGGRCSRALLADLLPEAFGPEALE